MRVYRTYTYGRVHYSSYVPLVYYQPAFYGWVYRPWRAPVVYAWGWGPAPWFYGGYFAPELVYPTAALWLTDFLLAENLKLAYENRMAASGARTTTATSSPGPKQPCSVDARSQTIDS